MASQMPGFSLSTRGFTTIELMVVVAILAVLAALAAPSLLPTMERWRVRQAAEELTASYAFARSEAIKRGGNVTLRRSTPGSAVCALPAEAADWSCGWTVFDDLNGNGALDAGEEVLRVSSPVNGTRVLSADSGAGSAARIQLSRWGEPLGGNVSFSVASTRSGSTVASLWCAGGGGRIRTKEGASTC